MTHTRFQNSVLSCVLALGLALLMANGTEAAQKSAGGNRQKVIDFDDEVVEGMNKRPLDSVSQLSEKQKRKKKPHLYRKRSGFRTESVETLKNMTYTH